MDGIRNLSNLHCCYTIILFACIRVRLSGPVGGNIEELRTQIHQSVQIQYSTSSRNETLSTRSIDISPSTESQSCKPLDETDQCKRSTITLCGTRTRCSAFIVAMNRWMMKLGKRRQVPEYSNDCGIASTPEKRKHDPTRKAYDARSPNRSKT